MQVTDIKIRNVCVFDQLNEGHTKITTTFCHAETQMIDWTYLTIIKSYINPFQLKLGAASLVDAMEILKGY